MGISNLVVPTLSEIFVMTWILLLSYGSSGTLIRGKTAMWLSGSVNTSATFTELYYAEGEVLSLTCHVGDKKRDRGKCIYGDYTWWYLYDQKGNVQRVPGIPTNRNSCTSDASYSEPIQLTLTKKHDKWLLECSHGAKRVFHIGGRWKTYGSVLVRLHLKQAVVPQEAPYMFLAGAVNYLYDATRNNVIQYYYTENEWLNVTCSLEYPDELAYLYDGRYMWWTLEDENGIETSDEILKKKIEKNSAVSNSIAVNMLLSKKYDMWSLGCRHAIDFNGGLIKSTLQDEIKISLRAQKDDISVSEEAPVRRLNVENTTNVVAEFTPKGRNIQNTVNGRNWIIEGFGILSAAAVALFVCFTIYLGLMQLRMKKQRDNNTVFPYEYVTSNNSPLYEEPVYEEIVSELHTENQINDKTKNKHINMKSKTTEKQTIIDEYALTVSKNQIGFQTSCPRGINVYPNQTTKEKIINSTTFKNIQSDYVDMTPEAVKKFGGEHTKKF